MNKITKVCYSMVAAALTALLVSCSSPKPVAASASPAGAGPSIAAAAVGSSSMPLFNGTGLDGWQSVGEGNWQAQNGELVSTAKGDNGGWLFSNTGYQDFVFRASFECSTCNTGVVVRAARSGANMTGIYIPLGGPQMGKLYRATLTGADEAPTSLKPMPSPPPPPGFEGAIDAGSCAPANCDGVTGAHGGSEGGRAMAPKPVQLHPGWNQLAVTIRGDVIIAGVNGTPLAQATMDKGPWYGQIALRTGGPNDPVHFKDLLIKDLTLRTAGEPALYTDPNFTRDQLTPWFYSEGITAGDWYHKGTWMLFPVLLFTWGPILPRRGSCFLRKPTTWPGLRMAT